MTDRDEKNTESVPPGGRLPKAVRRLQFTRAEEGETRDGRGSPKDGLVEFVVASRRAFRGPEGRKRSREQTEHVVQPLRASFDLLSDLAQPEDGGRRILRLRGTQEDLMAKFREIDHEHLVVDGVVPRHLAVSTQPLIRLLRATPSEEVPAGEQPLRLSLRAAGDPVRGARVDLYLVDKNRRSVRLFGTSDESGVVSFAHSAALTPVVAQIEPAGGAWGAVVHSPRDGAQVDLPRLVLDGPMGWWQLVVGAQGWDAGAGAGIRIGVADTGVGPHPFLDHVTRVGAFLGGAHLTEAGAGLDVANHGTHVCGLIGARPSPEGKGYGGIAPSAELYCARVFESATSAATNADITAAVDEFADYYEVDLVNLSLAGPASALEADAILFAYEQGTLCICAAGNDGDSHISFPAALPCSAAISALGLMGQAPAGSLSAQNLPRDPSKIAALGLFLASFSSFGDGVSVTAPGNGIISTVPATNFDAEPYAPMDGTSMAAPIAAGALAALLSRSGTYKGMERGIRKSQFATTALLRAAQDIGLQPAYQGMGIARQGSL